MVHSARCHEVPPEFGSREHLVVGWRNVGEEGQTPPQLLW